MKILQFLFSFGLILIILGVISIFGTREILVWISMEKMRGDFSNLKKRVLDGEFIGNCTGLGNFNTPGVAQIRFQDKQNYTLEVICGDVQSSPIISSKEQLPPLVEKIFGDSGVTDLSDEMSEVAINVLGRKAVIKQNEAGDLTWSYGEISEEHSVAGPPAACSAYGLTCCSTTEEEGYGKGIQGALDCPKSCFEGCWERPLILSFNTQPYYSTDSRTLTINSGEEVEFNYVISESQKDVFADSSLRDQGTTSSVILAVVSQWFEKKVQTQTGLQSVAIDYGDGAKALDTQTAGVFTHKYLCNKPICQYKVNLKATNQQGAEAQATNINSVDVIVRQ